MPGGVSPWWGIFCRRVGSLSLTLFYLFASSRCTLTTCCCSAYLSLNCACFGDQASNWLLNFSPAGSNHCKLTPPFYFWGFLYPNPRWPCEMAYTFFEKMVVLNLWLYGMYGKFHFGSCVFCSTWESWEVDSSNSLKEWFYNSTKFFILHLEKLSQFYLLIWQYCEPHLGSLQGWHD